MRRVPATVAPPVADDLAAWLLRVSRDVERLDLELRAGDRAVYVIRWSPPLDAASTIAAELRAAAAADGEMAAGPVGYQLDATHADGTTIGTIPLRVAGPMAIGPSATGSGADLLSTAHRHLEAQSALNLRLLTAASDAIRAVAEQARARAVEDAEELRYHREQARAVRVEREQLLREQLAREVAAEVDTERERRTSALLEQAAGAVLPALARRLAPPAAPLQGGAASAAATALDHVRRAWAHLSPETVDRIADELPPDVAMSLVGAMGAGHEAPPDGSAH